MREEVEEGFQLLKNDDKWVLSTGKIVEDSLYLYGKSQIADHPSQSLIFDAEQADVYIKNNVFTEQEIEEIESYKPSDFDCLPEEIKIYLSKLNCQSTNDLISALQYEAGHLKKNHLENWYNINIWSIIDSASEDLERIEIVRGEGVSLASSFRKNRKRTIEDVNNKIRKPLGHRLGILIREYTAKNTSALEFGAAEVAKELEDNGSKSIKAGSEKLPKVLKGMLDLLIERKQSDRTGQSTA